MAKSALYFKLVMADLKQQIKELIISSLELEDTTPEDIKDDEPLFGSGLGLDSIDALELGVALKKKFNIKLSAESEDSKKHFASVNALAEFINSEIGKIKFGGNKMTKEELFGKIQEVLESDFEIEKDNVKMDSKLFEDLDLDSIDAVDLLSKIKQYMPGKQIDPEMFKNAKTVENVIDLLIA